jgi:hypothetical protein
MAGGSAAIYLLGLMSHNEHQRESGLCSVCFGVAPISGQHNDGGVRKILANGQNRVSAIHDWHLEIHKSNVWTMSAEFLDRFASIAGFRERTKSDSVARTAAIPSRKTGWSSTIRIRMGWFCTPRIFHVNWFR